MLEHVVAFVFEFALVFTGHMLLWALSLGRYNVSSGSDTTAAVVGLLFWVVVVVVVWLAFFR